MSELYKAGNPKQKRRRAVRLREEALEKLKEALTESWNASPGPGKFTREEKASLLGVSRATAERILIREGVDRPSLAIAFKNVGLAWDDAFCEIPAFEVPLEVETSQITPEPRRQPKGLVVGLSIAILGAIASYALNTQLAPVEVPWKVTANNHRKLAGEAYHRGDFNLAREEIGKSLKLAQANESMSYLAESLRVVGDLALASGDVNAAREHFEFALRLRKEINQPVMLPALWEALGNVEIQAKNLGVAREYMMLCLIGFQHQKELVGIAMGCRGLGTVAHLSGDRPQARQWFEKGLIALKGLNQQDMATDIKARLALLDRDDGRLEEAKRTLQGCLEYWRSKNHERWVATTQFQLGTVGWLEGDRRLAAALLQESKSTYSRLGDRFGEQECNRWLSKAGQFRPAAHLRP